VWELQREPSFEGVDRFLVSFVSRIPVNRGVISLNHSDISLICTFLIVEGPAFDLRFSPMNASVRSKQSYCYLFIYVFIYFIYFDQASVDWLGVALREICRLKISVPQSRFGHKYYYTQSRVFVSFKISRPSATCKTCVDIDAYWMFTSDSAWLYFIAFLSPD